MTISKKTTADSETTFKEKYASTITELTGGIYLKIPSNRTLMTQRLRVRDGEITFREGSAIAFM